MGGRGQRGQTAEHRAVQLEMKYFRLLQMYFMYWNCAFSPEGPPPKTLLRTFEKNFLLSLCCCCDTGISYTIPMEWNTICTAPGKVDSNGSTFAPQDKASSSKGDDVHWRAWLSVNIDTHKVVDDDYGLMRIAQHLGKETALELYWQGVQQEENNDVDGAITAYKRAFKLWPALDSITLGGLPLEVRGEAKRVEGGIFDDILMPVIDVHAARDSQVVHCPGLLSSVDLQSVNAVRDKILQSEELLTNNPQNATHTGKECVFMNSFPKFPIFNQAPAVVGKMLSFAQHAWKEGNWSGSKNAPGPLFDIAGGVQSLSIRVIEYWTYSKGGGLVDNYHYDTDSILTIVCLLSNADDFDGGSFRTYESGGKHLPHTMQQGDTICFISHKYHNVSPVLSGIRRSLVMELWQGGVGQMGR